MNHFKKAFTLLEMTFVIVILGIVAGISSEVIATSYENYINQRAVYRSSIKTELLASQIVNRLSYAIPGSIVGRRAAGGGNTLVDITNIPIGGNNNIIALEWIGYDRDSFISRDTISTPDTAIKRRPGWSGFCDLVATNRPNPAVNLINFVTPGSNLNLTNRIIANLSAGRTAGAYDIRGSALYFPVATLQIHDAANTYLAAPSPGIYTVANPHNIQASALNTGFSMDINTLAQGATPLSERYMLAWSAYAIVRVALDGDGLNNDLVLRYNFRPWNNETYNAQAAIAGQKILIRDISVFRFTGTKSSIRFKICKPERTGTDSNGNPTTVAVCKEKVVIK